MATAEVESEAERRRLQSSEASSSLPFQLEEASLAQKGLLLHANQKPLATGE